MANLNEKLVLILMKLVNKKRITIDQILKVGYKDEVKKRLEVD